MYPTSSHLKPIKNIKNDEPKLYTTVSISKLASFLKLDEYTLRDEISYC